MNTLRSTFAGLGALTVASILGCSPASNQAARPEPTMTTAGRQATPSSHPAVAAVVTHEVTDYAIWKHAFEEHAGARQRAGIVGTHINRGADNPNLISVYLGASDIASLRGFLNSDDLKATMARAGVKGPPTVLLTTPVEDMPVKDRALPGAIVSHHVASYETWRKVFDEDAPSRAKAGIVGYAINRGVEDACGEVFAGGCAVTRGERRDAGRVVPQGVGYESRYLKAGIQCDQRRRPVTTKVVAPAVTNGPWAMLRSSR